MSPRTLTAEEKAKALQKPWVRRPVLSTNPSQLRQLQALSGPKTDEGKLKVLDNLQVGSVHIKHGGYVREIMTVEEAAVYDEWRKRFAEEFELNGSSDQLVLERILMEKVIEFRLFKVKQEKPTANIDRALADNQRRLLDALDALGVNRKQRIATQEVQMTSVAALALQFATQQAQVREQAQAWRDEEAEMLAAKHRRAQVVPARVIGGESPGPT